MKLYTSAALVDYLRSRGGVTQLYWDDFAVYSGWLDGKPVGHNESAEQRRGAEICFNAYTGELY